MLTVRDNGDVDISLRPVGWQIKKDLMARIQEALENSPGGILPVGDKSDTSLIQSVFPGVSKRQFKEAIGTLYKKGIVQPSGSAVQLRARSQSEEGVREAAESEPAPGAAKQGTRREAADRAGSKHSRKQTQKVADGPAAANSRGSSHAKTRKAQILVRGFPYRTTAEELLELFSPCGTVASIDGMTLQQKGGFRASGRAVITFAEGQSTPAATVLDAALALDGLSFFGRSLNVQELESVETEGCARIFIGNLNYDSTEELVREFIESVCGEESIVSCRMSERSDYAHVDLTSPEVAAHAVKHLDGVVLLNRPVRVDFALRSKPRRKESP